MKETGKGKGTSQDAFADFGFDDDFELDETELKELDRLESPHRLANGNYKCNHLCKDKNKYSISLQDRFLTLLGVDICVARKERRLTKRKVAGRQNPGQTSLPSRHLRMFRVSQARSIKVIVHQP